jgi:cellulose synthase/poly-beta-1,6-N-acetylglucosamine synthase-like glycosyltransferase
MTAPPLVSVVIPAFDEEADIAGCLAAVAAQDHPANRLEVIVVDGGSHDATVQIAREAARREGLRQFRVVSNPARRIPTSLNAGLAHATGSVLVRVDARSRPAPGYVTRCVALLDEHPAAGVVGGAQIAVPRADATVVEHGIARALRNRVTTGLSRYRRRTGAGPADTVWLGAFRTDELRRLGGWNPRLALNEDYELNQRYRRAGFAVWFDPDLHITYHPRRTLAALARQHFRFGRVKGTWWARGTGASPRHLVLLAAPVVAAGAMVAVERRTGPVATAAAALAVTLLVDALGTGERARWRHRLVSAAAITTYVAAWLIGAAVGAVGEWAGMEHADA